MIPLLIEAGHRERVVTGQDIRCQTRPYCDGRGRIAANVVPMIGRRDFGEGEIDLLLIGTARHRLTLN